MRYIVYGAGIGSMVAAAWLWIRLVVSWKRGSVIRYAKLATIIALTAWVVLLCGRINRYRKINNLRDQIAPVIELAVQHALAQPGTSAAEKIEIERQIREGTEKMIEWQIDHE